MGDGPRTLGAAVAALAGILRQARASSIYRTAPRYVVDQPDFFNLAVSGTTELEPLELLEATQAIEARFGRDRSKESRKGPRTLDIDILYLGDLAFVHPSLTLPHPGIRERAFVLVPLLELEPAFVDPTDGAPLAPFAGLAEGQGIYLFGPPPV